MESTRLRIVAVAVLATAVSSCGGSTTSTAVKANITVALSPNPVTATTCSPDPCQGSDGRLFRWRVQGTLAISETAGIGGNVDSVIVTAFNPQFTYTSADVLRAAGTTRVQARGTLAFPVSLLIGLADSAAASRQVALPYVVQLTDDRGNHVTGTVVWNAN